METEEEWICEEGWGWEELRRENCDWDVVCERRV